MVAAIRQTVTVGPGGRVEVQSPQLKEGARAEVIVLLEEGTASAVPTGQLAALDRLQKRLNLDEARRAAMVGPNSRRARVIWPRRMIFLDTNFLIGLLRPGTPFDRRARSWLAAGETLGISTIAWAEFLCGPLSPDDAAAAAELLPTPEPLLPADATRAAELFNATGRRRGSLADCLIAATCLRLAAPLATDNTEDFRPFEPMGLRIISV